MIETVFIVIFWGMFFIIAFLILPAWRRHHNAGLRLNSKNLNGYKQIVNDALKSFNCTCNWETDNDYTIVKYDYQSGHFRIRLEQGSPYVRLSYLFFFDTTLENIELVRHLCNQCNINVETGSVVYSTNEEKNTIDVHLITGLLLTDNSAKEILIRAMTGMFRWQNTFVKRFNEMVGYNGKSGTKDIEKDNARWSRELFLLREQEIMHQSAGPDWRQDVDTNVSLRQILATAMGIRDISPLRMSVCSTDGIRKIPVADILDYDLVSCIITNGQFVRDTATLNLVYVDVKHPGKERRLTVFVNSENSIDFTLYYRVTITLIPLSVNSEIPSGSSSNRAVSASVLVAYDQTSPKQRLDEFRYMWKEALEKDKKGEIETLTDEQRLICKCVDSQLGYNIYRGMILFEQKRFYEALLHLENAFHVMQSSYKDMKPSVMEKFYEVSYLIGFCYCELHQYQLAHFYLEITLPLHRVTYTEEYINALVNGGDFRAIDIIEGLITDIESAQIFDDEEEQLQNHFAVFLNFLKRRKAYVYIDHQRYGEAEKLLKKMLDDPDNSDFALNELAYIQRMRGEN